MTGYLIAGAAVLIALAVVVAVSARKARSDGNGDPDRQVLSQLRRAGSNLARPHEIEFFLYFPTEEAAREAGAHFEPSGYIPSVRPAADGSRWLCLLRRRMLPEAAALASARLEFTSFASRRDGEYDGWGTPVVD